MHAERIECAQAAVTAGKAAVEVGTATTKSLMPITRRFVFNETADAREVVSIYTDSDMSGAVHDETKETRIALASASEK
ncbi:hypothetical protein N7471_000773 [Penicillium samsonianum]|uniref:uncharacterized protein n=1 Tax=Penicillium samsonianum TaxID=1882272 RepID=UPI002546744A|nr:uncharacterized protein N7471_000773 [Penicillium samsonianum]KAJ6149574.1 hypothetical protein N7471_000773 [Penicillium samsonianum]